MDLAGWHRGRREVKKCSHLRSPGHASSIIPGNAQDMEPGRESQTAGHLPSMPRLPGSQGQASLINEISLALHVLDAADLRLLASGLRVRCFASAYYRIMPGGAVLSATP